MSGINVSATAQRPKLAAPDHPKRVGLIALATDLVSESDLTRIFAPVDMTLHVTRVPFANPTTPENLHKMLPHITDAARLLVPGTKLDAILYGCTSASAVIGDAIVTEAIQMARPGVPVVTPSGASGTGLRCMGARKLAVVTPYVRSTSEVIADYFAHGGFDIVNLRYMNVEDDREMARITGESIIAAAVEADHPDVEAIFISCTALQAANVAAEIEQRLGKPVVTSNQASAWMMTRLAGFQDYQPAEWGTLFQQALPAALAGVA